jgi:hypothetical protein
MAQADALRREAAARREIERLRIEGEVTHTQALWVDATNARPVRLDMRAHPGSAVQPDNRMRRIACRFPRLEVHGQWSTPGQEEGSCHCGSAHGAGPDW